MKDIFKQILIEQKDSKWTTEYYKRIRTEQLIPGKALILTGSRRSGKSTAALQIFEREKKDLNRSQILINFADDRLLGCTVKDLNSILEAFYEITDQNLHEKIDFYFDEIQYIEGWEFFIDRLLRNRDYRILITGSNSKLLSKEIGTAMRGRSLSYEIFPFSFKELLDWENFKISETTQGKSLIVKRFEEYLYHGGFPEVAHYSTIERIKTLQEYRNVLIHKDIVERHSIDPMLVQRFAQLCFGQFSQLITNNKMIEKLRSQGIKANQVNIPQLSEWFQETYFIHLVPLFTESIHKQAVNPKKIYFNDTGLICANYAGVSKNSGRLLENSVFIHLRRNTEQIYYWKNKKGLEVDFVTENGDLIQVCESIHESETREREIAPLISAMQYFKKKKSLLLTFNDRSSEIKTETGIISVLPAWKWML